jgi:hypothetical protein
MYSLCAILCNILLCSVTEAIITPTNGNAIMTTCALFVMKYVSHKCNIFPHKLVNLHHILPVHVSLLAYAVYLWVLCKEKF